MKKISIITILCTLGLLASCVKADVDPAYDMEKYPVNVAITAAYCSPFTAPKALQLEGEISTTPDADGKYSITFVIPKNLDAKYYDLSALRIKANVDYDVYIDPPLGGVHDLDGKTKEVKVYSPIPGADKEKIYVIKAYKSRN